MADQIQQQFGIDASQALQALQQLDTGFGQLQSRLDAVANSMQAFNRKASRSNSGLNKATTAANNYNQALTGLANNGLNNVNNAATNVNNTLTGFGRNARTAMSGAAKASGEFTVSWETLSRVVQTQFIVRAMSQIRDLISESVGEAIEFQKQVALIGTIAPDANFQQIATQVRSISDNFNLPLLETAKGVYQAISNQVGDFGDSLRFTEEAAKFAKATNSSLADSVDLLSGALRSYGLNVEDTAKVSGIFFTAIDKGRVTADQLANAFGRVGPSAQEVGITLEELSAAVASISDKGIATSESLTQFRGIITALTKPTDAMKAKLRELGFSSTESAIGTLRLSGLLEALAQSTDGSTQAFAKLFPNVRGIGGALSITGENLKTFAANIEAAQQNGEEYANSKFLTATNTDAERLTKALNQVSNAFTLELGNALVKTGAEFVSVEGRVEFLTGTVKTLAAAVPGLARSIGTLAIGLGALKLAAIATASPMALLVTTAGALAVAIPAALQAIDDKRTELAFSSFNKLQSDNAKVLEDFRKAENDKLRSAKEVDDAIVQGAFKRVQEINKQYLKDVENAKSANAAMVADTERSLDKIVDARTKFVQAIDAAINDSRQQVKDSQNRILDLEQRKDDRKFDFQTRDFDDAQKVFALTQRAQDTARQAEETLRKAFASGDDQLRQRALSQFQRADALGEQARAIAENADNRALEVKAARDLEDISNRQIQAEREINQAQQQRQKALEAERNKQEAIVAQIREQQKIVLDNTGAFDKQGQLFDPEEAQRRAARQQEALKKIAQLSFSSSDFKAADALGLGEFVRSIENDLSQRPIKLVFDIESSAQRVQEQIKQSLSQIDVQLPFLKQLEDVLGKTLRDSPDQINQGVKEVASEAQALRQSLAAQATADKEILARRQEIQALIQKLEERQPLRENLGEELQPAQQAVTDTITRLKELSNASEINVAGLRQELEGLGQLDFGSKFGTLASDAKLIGEAFQQASELSRQLDERQQAPPVDIERLRELQSILNQIGVDNLLNEVGAAATTISGSVQPISTIEQHAFNTATYYERAATALQNISGIQLPAITAGGPDTTAQFGKMMTRYFAKGGMARGMDTIPVMARAGESILTPEATSRWFSQIQAMNAGKTPVFRQDGGTINTNIGDISIKVDGSQTPEKTGRAVMREIRREIRRGSGRL
jgi:TP901 family phage tail tape measure protein